MLVLDKPDPSDTTQTKYVCSIYLVSVVRSFVMVVLDNILEKNVGLGLSLWCFQHYFS